MKKVKIITITLIIVLITMIAFGGIYVKKQNRMEDTVKGYSLAMDLKGSRVVRIKVSDETKTTIKDSNGNEVTDSSATSLTDDQLKEKGYTKEEHPYNSDDVKTVDNYKKSKQIIEKRMNQLGINNYIIKLDESNGDMVLELPENSNTDNTINTIGTSGKFEIVDSKTKEVLMTNADVKNAKVVYGYNGTGTSSGTAVYLDIEFNKEGTEKFKNISETYKKTNTTNTTDTASNTTNDTTNDTTENSTSEDTSDSSNNETTQKEITMKIDDEDIMTTSFDEVIENGRLQLSVGQASTDNDTLQNYVQQASSMALVLNTGEIPIRYEVTDNEYVYSDITSNEIQILIYVVLAITVIALLVLIFRYKAEGALGVISYIGLLSLLLIIIRYANVALSLEGIFGIIVALILNYIFINKLLSKLKKIDKTDKKNIYKNISKANREVYKDFFIKLIPVIIIVVTFILMDWVPISSFGMTMFWGIILIAAYNYVVTYNLIKIDAETKKGGNKKDEKNK